MLLSDLADRSGVSTATIKYYRREGVLPPGTRMTATRQDYGQEHLDRLRLVGVLREEVDASITDIRILVDVLDDPGRPLVDALEIAQALAWGLPAAPHAAPVPDDEDPLVRDLLDDLGWPDEASGPRAALGKLLRSMREAGMPVPRSQLLRYGRLLGELARGDLATLDEPARPDGVATGPGPEAPAPTPAGSDTPADGSCPGGRAPSRDAVVTRAVLGMVAYDRLARTVRALGHASYSLIATGRHESPGRRPSG